jgi:5-(carboxyamino)imidazole ribonucleotide mutase
VVPVLWVPIAATALQGMDALLSIVQMPKGIPVGTLAIGAAGAANAALLAIGMLAAGEAGDAELREKLIAWRASRRDEVLAQTLEDAAVVEGKEVGR